jgi:hypothetical protein
VSIRPKATNSTPDNCATVERHGGPGSVRRSTALSPTANHRNTTRLTAKSAVAGSSQVRVISMGELLAKQFGGFTTWKSIKWEQRAAPSK